MLGHGKTNVPTETSTYKNLHNDLIAFLDHIARVHKADTNWSALVQARLVLLRPGGLLALTIASLTLLRYVCLFRVHDLEHGTSHLNKLCRPSYHLATGSISHPKNP
ncbi:hypothetical protein F5141DRAFT_1149457 [Pisolithus sp. B1]|nr:hypothetical protein F5141DRAFT_1149457 [Pisolithus sp. B1]